MRGKISILYKMKKLIDTSELKIIKEIVRIYPNIASGRKNYKEQQKRILKNLKLIKNYFRLK